MNLEGSGEDPLRREGLVERAAARFREEVVSGRWPVKGRIPTEAELVVTFGVGRNTVREAVQSLVHAGLLRREQGRGTFVISASELAGPLERQLSGGSRRHYLELRLALDSTAASLAALRRTEDDVRLLRELRQRRVDSWASTDPHARADADLALHRAVVAAAHNPLYLSLYSSLLGVFTTNMHEGEVAEKDAARQAHHDLVEAIADADAERATALTIAIFDPFM